MMKSLLALIAALAIAAPVCPQERDYPQLASDPTCSSGDFFIYANTATNKLRMCQNGTATDIGTSVYTGTNASVGGDQYDPDRPPDSSNEVTVCSDEFDTAETGTWTWRNQGAGATWSTPSGADYGVMVNQNTTGIHARTCTINNSADWTMTVKFTGFNSNGGSGDTAGLAFVDLGTCAAPSGAVGAVKLLVISRNNTASNFGQFGIATASSYTANPGVQPTADTQGTSGMAMPMPNTYCIQARYNVTTNVMTGRISQDCRNWASWGTATHNFTNDPTCGGIFLASGNSSHFARMVVQWVRTRTDSAATSGEYIVGK